jgi:hypothetical protein
MSLVYQPASCFSQEWASLGDSLMRHTLHTP